MKWETPKFEEIKMDAEIGSYQLDEDEGPGREQDAAAIHAGVDPIS